MRMAAYIGLLVLFGLLTSILFDLLHQYAVEAEKLQKAKTLELKGKS